MPYLTTDLHNSSMMRLQHTTKYVHPPNPNADNTRPQKPVSESPNTESQEAPANLLELTIEFNYLHVASHMKYAIKIWAAKIHTVSSFILLLKLFDNHSFTLIYDSQVPVNH